MTNDNSHTDDNADQITQDTRNRPWRDVAAENLIVADDRSRVVASEMVFSVSE